MNILLPILSNLIILGFLIVGLFVGQKYGGRLQAIKLVLTAGIAVGSFFILPVLFDLLMGVEFIAALALTELQLKALIFSLTFFIVQIFNDVTFMLIYKFARYEREVKQTKVKRAKSIDKKTERLLAKQDRVLKKIEKDARFKEISKSNKVLGMILGVITFFIIGAFILYPTKMLLNQLSVDTSNEEINTFYEYTPYGQLDELVDFDKYIKGE